MDESRDLFSPLRHGMRSSYVSSCFVFHLYFFFISEMILFVSSGFLRWTEGDR